MRASRRRTGVPRRPRPTPCVTPRATSPGPRRTPGPRILHDPERRASGRGPDPGTMTRRAAGPDSAVPLSLVPVAAPATDPRLRPERVAEARERIARHHYDRDDVRRALVEALLVEFAA